MIPRRPDAALVSTWFSRHPHSLINLDVYQPQTLVLRGSQGNMDVDPLVSMVQPQLTWSPITWSRNYTHVVIRYALYRSEFLPRPQLCFVTWYPCQRVSASIRRCQPSCSKSFKFTACFRQSAPSVPFRLWLAYTKMFLCASSAPNFVWYGRRVEDVDHLLHRCSA